MKDISAITNLLLGLLNKNDADAAQKLAEFIPPLGLTESRSKIIALLRSENYNLRIMGLFQAITAMAPGAQPYTASLFGESLLSIWWSEDLLPWFDEKEAWQLYGNLAKTTAYAQFVCGDFDRCIELIDQISTIDEVVLPDAIVLGGQLIKIHALFRMLKIEEAKLLFDTLDHTHCRKMPEYDRVVGLYKEYDPQFDQTLPIFDFKLAISNIINNAIPHQRKGLLHWVSELEASPITEKPKAKAQKIFKSLGIILDDLEQISKARHLPLQEKYENISRGLFTFQQQCNELLSGPKVYSQHTSNSTNLLVNEAMVIESFGTFDKSEITELVSQLKEAENFCRTHKDWQTICYVIRVQQLLFEKIGEQEAADNTALRLLNELSNLSYD